MRTPKIQKLRLHRETVCALEPGQLQKAGGGLTGAQANCSEVLFSCFNTCNTRNTCTSRLC